MTQKSKTAMILIIIAIPIFIGLLYIIFINKEEKLTGYWGLRIVVDNAKTSYSETTPSKLLYFTDREIISSICIDNLIQQKFNYEIEDNKIKYHIDGVEYYYEYLLKDELIIRTLAANETFTKISEKEYNAYLAKCK